MKNITRSALITAAAGFTMLVFAPHTRALDPGALRTKIRETVRQEIKKENTALGNIATATGKTIREEIKQETKDLRKNILDSVKDKIKALLPRRIHGTIVSIGGDKTSLVVKAEAGEITVYISSKTQIKRRFGGNSSIAEFAVGDEVAVMGAQRVTVSSSSSSAAADTSLDARYIRNLSIQRRNTVFVGKITDMGTNGFTVETVSRGTQTVYVLPATVITQKDAKIGLSDLKTGDRVLVKGIIWDRALDKIDAAKILKLPQVPASGKSSSSSSAASSASSSSSSAGSASSSSVI